MSDPYERAKGGRLTFKGGTLATRKSIDKKRKKKNKHKINEDDTQSDHPPADGDNGPAGHVYTIDAAKNLNYDQLFPVEAKKFGYDPKLAAAAAAANKSKTVEEALDDRVKKKADRYCK